MSTAMSNHTSSLPLNKSHAHSIIKEQLEFISFIGCLTRKHPYFKLGIYKSRCKCLTISIEEMHFTLEVLTFNACHVRVIY